MPLGSYSAGMRLRLAFSIVVSLQFDILVIDEVLAVGDALFQNKCYQRLMDLHRAGKTLVITTQGMELIERLCERVVLLDHGRLVFQGGSKDGIQQYRQLLNSEEFFVGPRKREEVFSTTKKWAEDKSGWGKQLGAKEVMIDSVSFLNKSCAPCEIIKSGQPLTIRATFTARDEVLEPHFGVALFRNDGVYCYGPNTGLDGIVIPKLRKGKGWFELYFKEVFLAPGEYRISVAVWDRNEVVAYDYHEGCYSLVINGLPKSGALLRMPFSIAYSIGFDWLRQLRVDQRVGFQEFSDASQRQTDSLADEISVQLCSLQGERKNTFLTLEPVVMNVTFSRQLQQKPDTQLWIGIFRDDDVYCQGFTLAIPRKGTARIIFKRMPLLPGGYKVILGLWGKEKKQFLRLTDTAKYFNMVFNRADHGTVFLAHEWRMGDLK